MSIVASLAVLICLGRVYYLFFFCGRSAPPSKVEPKAEKEGQTHTDATKNDQQKEGERKEEEDDQDFEREDEVLPRKTLESIHLWILIAAFCSLMGPPITPLLLSSAVYVGATIKPKIWDGKGDIFYKLGAGQRRLDTDY